MNTGAAQRTLKGIVSRRLHRRRGLLSLNGRPAPLLALACLCASVVLTACGSSTEQPSKPRHGGTLTIAAALEPDSLDPPLGGDAGAANTDAQLFDQLVKVTAGKEGVKSGLAPDLAQSWKRSADGLSYTFHLRAARFSNGAPVTGEDVAFSLNRGLNHETAPVQAEALGPYIKHVTSPDRSTVVVRLKQATPVALNLLALTTNGIVPKAYFLKVGAKGFAEHPIGSGPFKLDHWQRAQELVLTRNPYYWQRGLPYLDKVVVKFVADDNARILALKSGAIDVDDSVAYSQLSALESQPGIDVSVQPVAATFAVVLNMNGNPLLHEKAVRQALNYATPKSAIVKVVFDGKARIANSIIPPLEHWDASVAPYPYDVAKARDLLTGSKAAAGLSLKLDVLSGNESAVQTATILQQSWAKVGVKLTVREVPAATLFQDLTSGQADAEIWNPTQWASDMGAEDEWGGLLAPTSFFGSVLGYKNEALNNLISQATSTLDESKRKALWTEIQKTMLEDAPWVPIAYPTLTSAVRSNVVGFGFLPTVWWRPLETVYVN